MTDAGRIQGGLGAVAGNKEATITEPNRKDIEFIDGMNPQNQFVYNQSYSDKDIKKKEKDCENNRITIENIIEQSYLATLSGYKTHKPATLEPWEKEVPSMPRPDQDVIESKILADIVNEESHRWRWGRQEYVPNYGQNLKGSQSTKTMTGNIGKLIVPYLAKGDSTGGYSVMGGTRMAQYRVSGTINDYYYS